MNQCIALVICVAFTVVSTYKVDTFHQEEVGSHQGQLDEKSEDTYKKHLGRYIPHIRNHRSRRKHRANCKQCWRRNEICRIKRIRRLTRLVENIKYNKVSVCKLPARKHDDATWKVAEDLYKKLDRGYKQYTLNNGELCHAQNKLRFLQGFTQIQAKERRLRRTIRERFGPEVSLRLLRCISKGTQQDGTLNMCHDCLYRLTLPDNFIDQNHIVHLCDSQPNDPNVDDYSCMRGEGTCLEIETIRNLLKRNTRSQNLEREQFSFTIACSCQIRENSVFARFVR